MVERTDELMAETSQFLAERTYPLQDGDHQGEFVLYWMRNAARGHENPALDLTVHLANERSVPPLVYQGISEEYPHASDRHHTFMLQGVPDAAEQCREKGIPHVLHVQRRGHRSDHLRELARRAACVVVEEVPVDPNRTWLNLLVERVETPVLSVDTDCLVPVRTLPPGLDRAYKFRNATEERRERALEYDWPEPEPDGNPTRPDNLGFEPVDPETMDLPDLLDDCEIDHSVPPVPDREGGSSAGYARWNTFRSEHLDEYHDRRNNPTQPEAVSRLSPYLHYGHVSPFRIAREAHEQGGDGPEKFVDELVTWREMAHYFCYQESDHDSFDGLPDWAQKTLLDHAEDPRSEQYTLEELASARTGNEFWNLCQEWLLHHGELHNNLRMTWAKQILQWTDHPRQALQATLDLNNRYALDGSDPNSYLGILWCFGAFDRPFDEERPVTGRLRPRSTDWHANRVDTDRLRSYVKSPRGRTETSVGIVGVGVAGATCASILARQGVDVTLYEKSRGHGGRASTRYTDLDGPVTFDHGAQYFTVRDSRMARWLSSWTKRGVVGEWDVDPAVIEDGAVVDFETGSDRYVGVPKMNELVKHLAGEVERCFETRVVDLQEGARCRLSLEDAEPVEHDRVVFTPPPAQTAGLLSGSHDELAKRVSSVETNPTWSCMLAFEESLDVEYDAAFVNDGPLGWIARNNSKPGREPTEAWVLHATPEWSGDHVDAAPEAVIESLREAFADLVGPMGPTSIHRDAHRWLYARVPEPGTEGFLAEGPVVVAGDWLHGSRVEGAYLSGQAAAGRILRDLSPG